MRIEACVRLACIGAFLLAMVGQAQEVSNSSDSTPHIVQSTLIAPGNPPFELKAVLREGRDPTPTGHVEMLWMAPNRWRRTIESDDFSQTLIVNGDSTFEQDSTDYFPVGLSTLVTAMVDPKPIIDAHRPDEQLLTKANGASSESGMLCFGKDGKLCLSSPNGLTEIVGMPGHSVTFTNYEKFKEMRVARVLIDTVGVGESQTARVTELKELKNPDAALFSVPQPTPIEQRVRSVVLQEADFRSLALATPEIIWPQVLDGRTSGTASFYVSLDRTGRVREVLPVHTDNERSNDSARNQIMRWKFKPALENGVAVQAQSVLTFALNTRAFGPPDFLSDAEARKLASNIVEPMIPPGAAPSGTIYTLRAAVDADGNLIEVIPAEGIPGLFEPCYQALRQWRFRPIMENGQPRPYRAEIQFRVP